jgi:hypothetical protein
MLCWPVYTEHLAGTRGGVPSACQRACAEGSFAHFCFHVLLREMLPVLFCGLFLDCKFSQKAFSALGIK